MSPKLRQGILFLLLLSAAVSICNSLDADDPQNKLTQYRINDEIGYEQDMLIFLEQSHHFTKTARNAGSIAVMKVANLHANQANIKHAIRMAAAEVAGVILGDYSTNTDEDYNEASAVLARVMVRAKVTILEATASLWKLSFKLMEQHREANGMSQLIEEILERLERDQLSLLDELRVQEESLSRFKFSDYLSETNFLQSVDLVIDDAFNCGECSGLALAEWNGVTPLATEETIDEWVAKYVSLDYLEKLEKSEEHIAGLIEDPSPTEWQSVQLEGIEDKLRKLNVKH